MKRWMSIEATVFSGGNFAAQPDNRPAIKIARKVTFATFFLLCIKVSIENTFQEFDGFRIHLKYFQFITAGKTFQMRVSA
jgi:hypothetical protein